MGLFKINGAKMRILTGILGIFLCGAMASYALAYQAPIISAVYLIIFALCAKVILANIKTYQRKARWL